MATTTEDLRRFVRRRGLVRAREVEAAGFPTALLYRLRDRGELEQVGRGLFQHPEAEISEHQSYAEAARLVPAGVICLLSAAAFHEMGTQNPSEVWLAVRQGSQRPAPTSVPLKVVWFSAAAMEAGVESHPVVGAEIQVFSPAKTVADLFKYRNKIGLGVAIEALRDGWNSRLFTADELLRQAAVCRVERVIRPYLEAIA